jgi:hypothetical protein
LLSVRLGDQRHPRRGLRRLPCLHYRPA